MAKVHFSRNDFGDLRERLEARGTSHVLRDRPELCRGMSSAAALLRFMLDHGMPVTSVEIEVVNGS
ncbi:MAG TPA: hypothetical protein VNO18_12080 [Xanthobacteraceae bacterium]|jgi:hypothetical protein|nr:hypothetical protein [Xanthobacteraceae bacterium]